MKVPGSVQQVPALHTHPDQGLRSDGVRQELRRQEGHPDAGEELGQGLTPQLRIELDPRKDGVEDDLLRGDVQLVFRGQADQAIQAEVKELVAEDDVDKELLDELVASVDQEATTEGVGKAFCLKHVIRCQPKRD